MTRLLSLLILPLLCLSCGYHCGQGTLANRYSTISIPYIAGDEDGRLTSALVQELASSGALRYVQEGGDLTLCVTCFECCDENIGYRYEHKKNGRRTNTLIPTETRIKDVVEVVLKETSTGHKLLGPTRLSASVDFDHEYTFSPHGINVFSLGQLTDVDSATEAVTTPLSHVMAKKIVDYVIYGT